MGAASAAAKANGPWYAPEQCPDDCNDWLQHGCKKRATGIGLANQHRTLCRLGRLPMYIIVRLAPQLAAAVPWHVRLAPPLAAPTSWLSEWATAARRFSLLPAAPYTSRASKKVRPARCSSRM